MSSRCRRILPLALAVLCVHAGAAAGADVAEETTPAAAPVRVRVVLNGNAWFTNPSFADSRRYTEYAETATVSTSSSLQTGFGPDLGVQVSLYRGLGLMVGYSLTTRSLEATFDARRPHPLYLDRPRSLAGELSGYQHKEGAVHLDLAYGRGSGRLDWSLFAGATLFQLETEMLERPYYVDNYPYDELKLASGPATRVKSSPTGFNLGGRLDLRFGRRLGAGVQLRYSTARVKLRATADSTATSFDAGGLQAGAGVRLYF